MIDTEYLANQLRHRFPEGVERYGSRIGNTRDLVAVTVEMLAAEFKKITDDMLLDLERDSTEVDVRGFIIHFKNKTETVDLVVSQGLVRLRGHPIYLCHPEAAPNLMLALLAEVEMVVDSASDAAA